MSNAKSYLTALVTPLAVSILAFSIFAVSSSEPAHGAEDSRRDQIRQRIKDMPLASLIGSGLSVSWDLRAYDKYHCYYNPDLGPKPCAFMDTVSGHYEDFYWSTMGACKSSKICSGGNMNVSFYTYASGRERICADLETGSCAKEILSRDQMQEELIDLLLFQEDLAK